MSPFRMFLGACALAAVSACGTVGSSDVDPTRPYSTVGQVYYLPKVLFEVGVRQDQDNLVFVLRPMYVADTQAGPLALRHSIGLLSNDDVDAPVDRRGLLQTIDATFDSEAEAILKGLGTIFPQSALSDNFVAHDVIDPADAYDLAAGSAAINAQLADWATRQLGPEPTLPERATSRQREAHERQLADYRRRYAQLAPTVSMQWSWEGDRRVVAPPALDPADPLPAIEGARNCHVGVCVRSPRAGRFRLYRGNVLVGTYSAAIPNRAPRTVIPIQGGLFADRTIQIEFENGMPIAMHYDSSSEANGAVTSAVAFLAAGPTAAVSNSQSETNVIDAQTNESRARARRDAALRDEQNGVVPPADGAPSPANNNQGGDAPVEEESQPQGAIDGEAPAAPAATGEDTGDVGTPEPGRNQGNGGNRNAGGNGGDEDRDTALREWSVRLFAPLPQPQQRGQGQNGQSATTPHDLQQ